MKELPVVNCGRDVRLGCIERWTGRGLPRGRLPVEANERLPPLFAILFLAHTVFRKVVAGDQELGMGANTASVPLNFIHISHGPGSFAVLISCSPSLSFSRSANWFGALFSCCFSHSIGGTVTRLVAFDRDSEQYRSHTHYVALGTSYDCAGKLSALFSIFILRLSGTALLLLDTVTSPYRCIRSLVQHFFCICTKFRSDR